MQSLLICIRHIYMHMYVILVLHHISSESGMHLCTINLYMKPGWTIYPVVGAVVSALGSLDLHVFGSCIHQNAASVAGQAGLVWPDHYFCLLYE